MAEVTILTGILDAWSAWYSDKPISESHQLWGHKIFWWGRIGILLQFLGGATILLEIIGPERLRTLGPQMRGLVTFTALLSKWRGGFFPGGFSFRAAGELIRPLKGLFLLALVVFAVLFALLPWPGNPVGEGLEKLDQMPAHIQTITVLLMLILLIGGGVLLISSVMLGAMFLLAAAITFFLISISTLEFLFLKPAIYLLEHPKLDWLAKLFAFFALVVGFHFDLLAS